MRFVRLEFETIFSGSIRGNKRPEIIIPCLYCEVAIGSELLDFYNNVNVTIEKGHS